MPNIYIEQTIQVYGSTADEEYFAQFSAELICTVCKNEQLHSQIDDIKAEIGAAVG